MSSALPVPESVRYGHASRRILVLEPSDIKWMGMYQLLRIHRKRDVYLHRIRQPGELGEILDQYNPDALLLTSVGRGTEVLPLLPHLSDSVMRYPRLHIVTILNQEMAHLADLLHGFGSARIFPYVPEPAVLLDSLSAPAAWLAGERSSLMTLQERNVVQAMLAGYSVSQIAQQSGKNVRTISAQKQSLMLKLKMTNTGELQVLGGKLKSLSLLHSGSDDGKSMDE